MAGWHHQCYAHELGQILRDGEGQGGLAYCVLWVAKSRATDQHAAYGILVSSPDYTVTFVYFWLLEQIFEALNFESTILLLLPNY